MKSFRFDPYSGAAVFSLPLASPPGRRNMTPAVQLVYSPRNGNGPLGLGWQIPFPAIERSLKNGVPTYTNTDTFISTLGGSSQELVAISSNEYRARVQGDFTKYIFNGNSWEAYDRAGNTYYFGLDALLEDDSQESDNGRVLRWQLSEVKDILGNYYYIRHFANGEFEILFTGEPGTDRAPLSSPAHKFYAKILAETEAATRPDIITSNISGFRIAQNTRLKNIIIMAGGTLQRRYELQYTISRLTSRSLLSGIIQYGADDISTLPPITMKYADDIPSYSISSISGDPTIGDNLWSVRSDISYDFYHDCYGVCPPQTMCYGVQWEAPKIQLSGTYSCNSWSGNGHGSFRLTGCQDTAMLFSTYVYVKEPKTFTVTYQAGDSSHGVFINGDYSPRGILQSQTWNLQAGYNLIEITDYHQHQSYWFDLNFNLADTVDLMNSTQVIQPQFAADFNGDGLSDTATFFDTTGTVKVALSNGTGFLPKGTWISPFGNGKHLTLGDFNADGRADIAAFNRLTGDWVTAFSDGTKFIPNSLSASGFGQNGQAATGDLNGDHHTDLIAFVQRSGKVFATFSVNQKDHFTPQSAQVELGSDPAIPLTGDFNADSLIDLASFEKTTGTWKTFINQGGPDKGFELSQTITDWGTDMTPVMTDFNSDGFTDIGYFDPAAGKLFFRAALGTDFAPAQELPVTFALKDLSVQVQTADFNGDGLTDFFIFNPIAEQQIALSNGTFSDLLHEFKNGVGGKTTISYRSSTGYQNTYLPINLPVVNEIQASNGRGNEYKTTYNYNGGLWDPAENEFLGFAVVQSFDAENNMTETKFIQEDIYKRGLPYSTEFTDAKGNLYAKTLNTWSLETVNNTTPPVKFVKLDRSDNFIYDGNASGKRTAVVNEYAENPQYGNPTKSVKLGEVDLLTGEDIGSDSIETETHYQNIFASTHQVLGLPFDTIVKDHAGSIIAQSWMFYDGHEEFTDTPQNGLLTKTRVWAGTDSGHPDPESQIMYDEYGNIEAKISPLGYAAHVYFDDDWHLFPVRTENALGQITTTEYYGVAGVAMDNGAGAQGLWGQVKTITDLNQQKDLNIYDTFGRSTVYISPIDSITYPTLIKTTDHFDDHTRVTTLRRVQHGHADTIKTVSFFDGFGRLIQTKSPASESGRFIVSGNTEYNSLGMPEHKYFPVLSSNDQASIDPIDTTKPRSTVEYDPAGRPVKTTNPDGTYTTIAYDDWQTTAIDPNGHKLSSFFDAYGRLIETREFTGSDGRCVIYPAHPYSVYATSRYFYSPLGNITRLEDAKGHVTTIEYDTLGRKNMMDDPDMGVWNYGYDTENNLRYQTDARGQTIEYTYDKLNRLINKTDKTQLNVTYTYDDPQVPFSRGKITRIEYTGGATAFDYDAFGRETGSLKTIGGEAFSVRRTYDALGNVRSLQYPDSETTFYQYDPAGKPQAVSDDETILPASGMPADGLSLNTLLEQAGKALAHAFRFIEPLVFGVEIAEAAETMPTAPVLRSPYIDDDAQIRLSWNYMNDVRYYQLHMGTTPGHYTQTLNLTSWGYEFNDYQYDTTYYFAVTAVTWNGTSDYSNEISITTPIEPPDTPVLESAVNDNGMINLIWNTSARADGYRIWYGETPWALTDRIDVGSQTTYSIGDLTSGKKYCFLVRAYNTTGDSAFSNMINATPLPGGDGTGLYIKNAGYNATGQINRIEYGNGDITTNEYNPLNFRLTRIHTVNKNGTVLQDLNYEYDAVGNIVKIIDQVHSASQQFHYDHLNRLTQAEGAYGLKTYTYDEIGNILTKDGKSYEYAANESGPHAVTSLSDGSLFSYDHNGNMTGRVNGQDGSSSLYDYDIENRLIGVKRNGQTLALFAYDGDGGRTLATTRNITTTYVGSLFDTDITGPTRHIFFGSNRAVSVHNGMPLYYHTDHLGGTNVLTDQGGDIKELFEYKPFGTNSRHERFGMAVESTKYAFTGKETDDLTGLYYYGARYYDPALARFVSADTLVVHPNDPQDLNRYAYCRNNPVNLVDPTGHGWGKWWKNAWDNFVWAVKHPFDIQGQWDRLVGEANQPGIAPITSAVITVASFMFMQPELFLTNAMWTSTAASAGSTAFLQSPAGQDLTDWTAKNIYDDIFGMRPGTARIWAGIDLGMTSSFMIERTLTNIIADPAGTRSLTNDEMKKISSNSYFAGDEDTFGPSLKTRGKFRNSEVKALTQNGRLVGSYQRYTLDMPGFKELGAQHSSANVLAVSGPQLNPWRYATWGVCHQATNATLLQGGISSTILTLGPSWDMFVTTAVYGNYGGQLGHRIFTGINSKNE